MNPSFTKNSTKETFIQVELDFYNNLIINIDVNPFNIDPHYNLCRVIMSIIKGDSLLSSISNISVLIKHGEGSEVFNFSMLHNNNEHEQS